MADAQLAAFIKALPKAELHLHLEGSLEPELMFDLARRNNVSIPFDSVEAVRAAYRFSNLQDFLDIYYQGAQVLLRETDFHALTLAYMKRAHADGVVHAEVFFDPQTHTDRGVAMATVVNGITRALDEAEAQLGMSSRLILCFLRHLPESAAFETLKAAEPFLHRIHGVGLDSSEKGFPPSLFERVFAEARRLGLRVTAHAGEEGPPDYVREALDLLKVERIDHGNRALEDEALTRRLAREGMTLTVCPLSNLRLCVVDDLRRHPIKRMLELGLKATVNSDDPAYFGGYVAENFTAVADAVGLTRADCVQLARNSFEGAFLSETEKARRLAQVDAYAAAA
jgi:adenine deaminase